MAVMVTGGAGYIGSHTVVALAERGWNVVVVHSLIKGHKKAVLGGRLYIGDIRDRYFMDRFLMRTKLILSFTSLRILKWDSV